MPREVTKQNLEILIETLIDSGCIRTIWYAGHTDLNGGSLHFGNRWEMSIRWGTGNYGSRRGDPGARRVTAEIAVWSATGEWALDGDVMGWQTFDDIAALAEVIANDEMVARV